jgi:hypothetical protein
MRIVFTSINQGRQLFDPRGPVEEITFPMNCRGKIIPFPSDISRFSRDTDGRKQGFGTCPESRSGNAIRSAGELIHRCREISEGRSESRVSMREMSDALLTAQC